MYFLLLKIYHQQHWKNCTDEMTAKLYGTGYILRSVFHSTSTDIVTTIYFACFQSVMKLGIFLV